ncbi:HAD family hydrolase [Stutzerimonas stutzeri]|uniref:HAD family hydrolase n=1 Tax=Stutzerimonas stutzeri TaxID=316 RepID=UPI000A702F22|nr:HAD hydrolase-like protein [Stutzerimonas stutzeri]
MKSLPRTLEEYGTVVFDCDGVLLDSNRIKTEAFHAAAMPYGDDAAQQMVAYHKAYGGISRQEKFRWFFLELLGHSVLPEDQYHQALDRYARQVREGLEQCAVAPGVQDLLRKIPESCQRYVVSGGAEDEVRWVLGLKGLAGYFQGIYGNPTDKLELVRRLEQRQAMPGARLYVGDARYDHVVAEHFGMDFLFVSGLTEFQEWSAYCQERNILVVEWLSQLALESGLVADQVLGRKRGNP